MLYEIFNLNFNTWFLIFPAFHCLILKIINVELGGESDNVDDEKLVREEM